MRKSLEVDCKFCMFLGWVGDNYVGEFAKKWFCVGERENSGQGGFMRKLLEFFPGFRGGWYKNLRIYGYVWVIESAARFGFFFFL